MTLLEAVFGASPAVRYVALYRNGTLSSRQRADIASPSAGESDKYEELIVNPTLITLLRQRGDIDCGGLRHVVIRYGNFLELVVPLRDGHLSVGVEPQADPTAVAAAICELPLVAEARAGARSN